MWVWAVFFWKEFCDVAKVAGYHPENSLAKFRLDIRYENRGGENKSFCILCYVLELIIIIFSLKKMAKIFHFKNEKNALYRLKSYLSGRN
jgi:hypothetical protein